jgi:hypothetical protein
VTKEDSPRTIVAPSREKIAKATFVALLVASVVLVTTVLPAEYGIDPLGAGAALGLLNLSTAVDATAGTAVPVQSGVVTPQPNVYKVDSRDFTLYSGEGFEFKYRMEKGAVMVYSWKATGKLLFEFHGEPDQKPNKDYYDSYELDDKVGKEQSYGSFTAPSTGIHGWFFENKGEKEVTIRLTTAGFYTAAKQYSIFGIEDLPVEDVK